MKWSEEAREAIIAALFKRVPDQRLRPCAVCGTTLWRLQDGIASVEASSDFYGWPYGSPSHGGTYASRDLVYPFAILSCSHCGNSQFLNLRVLGLDYLFVPPDPPPSQPPPKLLT